MILVVLGIHLGRAVANVLAGCDWGFPTRVDMFSSLPALRGDAVSRSNRSSRAGRIAVKPSAGHWHRELILLAAIVLLIKLGLDRWVPGRTRGVATSSEAEKLLGVTPVRRSKIVRHDLYGERGMGLEMIFNSAEVASVRPIYQLKSYSIG
jgi:hypothetical protein